MRCRKARRLLGEYIDGELSQRRKENVSKHITHCNECASREHSMRKLVAELGSLPQKVLTPPQEAKLKLAITSCLESASQKNRPRYTETPVHRAITWSPMTAAALVALILGAAGLAYGLVAKRGPFATEETGKAAATAVSEAERGARFVQALVETTGEEMELPVEPAVDLSGRPLNPGDLDLFSEDVPTRLQFYSSYWYPLTAWERGSEALSALKAMVYRSLLNRTADLEHSQGLRVFLDGLIARLDGSRALPCYVAYVLWEGNRPAWLVSFSTSSDAIHLGDAVLGLDTNTLTVGATTGRTLSGTTSHEIAVYFLYHLLSHDPGSAALPDLGNGEGEDSSAPEREKREWAPNQSAPANASGKANNAEDVRELVKNRIWGISPSWGGESLINAWQNGDYGTVLRMISSDWRGFCEAALRNRRYNLVPRWIWVADAATGEVLYKADPGL